MASPFTTVIKLLYLGTFALVCVLLLLLEVEVGGPGKGIVSWMGIVFL